ncbi:hypothetical protein [Arenimonas sp.]|uniref:hypothetical protein n=1 Tax=Arenimonas sp. TaxID=1872635 RepID=UPI0039E2F594
MKKMFALAASALTIAVSLAACSRAPEPAPTPAPAAEPAPAPEPATSPEAPATLKNDPAVVNFEGFGPAKFGANQEQVRMAWGRPLEASNEAGDPESEACYYLTPDPAPPDRNGINFMMEEGKFVRYSVDGDLYAAPGDILVGMTEADVLAKFPGRVEQQPHKYTDGKYLVVSPEGGGESRLVFETDEKGVIERWRIGVPPAVHYVEGCL